MFAVPFIDMLGVAVIVILMYALWFWVHFWYLPFTGEGDAFMSIEFQRNLLHGPHSDVSFGFVSRVHT
jgi:dolichyl-phosphate-mannose--protein O-mannosyl transferase